MTKPYTTQTISGFNSSPPGDDGSQVSTNEIKWATHLDKLGTPVKNLSEAINTELLSAFGLIFGQTISSHSGNYTVVAGDQGKFLDVTGTTTITLLAAATAGASFALAIINNGTGVVAVDGNGAETINGSATITLNPGESIILTCNATLWIGVKTKTEEVKGADIASATTTDIGVATGEFVDITGTTTITGFGTISAGVKRTLQFDGSLTLTYNATSMILPGNADIVTQAGDVAEFISLGSGNWLCTNYENHYSVSGYISGVTEYLEADTGVDPTGFDIDAVIGSTFESIGPTGSSATNIWADMDIIPLGAKWVKVRIHHHAIRSGSPMTSYIYGRKTGSSTAFDNSNKISALHLSASGAADFQMTTVSEANIPLDSSNRFDLYLGGTATTVTADMYLAGWVI